MIPSAYRYLLPAIVLTYAVPVWAQAPAATPEEIRNLESTLHKLLLANLPNPIIETKDNWDHQKESVVGIRWEKLKPVPQKAVRNDGHWQKVRAEAIEPGKTLSVKVTDVVYPEPGLSKFQAQIGLDTRITYENQMWASGRRFYGGETRCKCRSDLKLQVELTNKFEPKPGEILPVLTFRVKVTKAELNYYDLVCEHTLGMNGKVAEIAGNTVIEFVKKVKPDMEKDLLAKANAAIVKAADTKEIRVEFDQLLKGKPAVTRDKK